MHSDALSFFNAFYIAVAELEHRNEQLQAFKASLQSELTGLDPIAAKEEVQKKLHTLRPDEQLLNLYDSVNDFQLQATGESFQFEKDHPFVAATSEVAKRLSGANKLSIDFLPQLVDAIQQAVYERNKIAVLKNYIDANSTALNEYRLQKLSEKVTQSELGHSKDDVASTLGEFTHTQQAIAIHYLFHEALGISGIDNIRLMEFAHLLSAKKIPLNKETGKENIRNSGIKSAFNKAWKKEDANHLADLRFVLRFFKPLNVIGATGIQNAVTALEKRIARLTEKLSREKD